MPKVGEDRKDLSPYTLLLGMQNIIAPLKNNLAASYKVKPICTIWSSNLTPKFLPKEVKTYIHTKACMQMFITV